MSKRAYFAAANSYRGFISYFDRIFNSENFKKVFVIKGGPGTGKSTLMKKISEKFNVDKNQIDEIYCSSDPTSLDGLIIKNESGAVALLDGTAPHERDAIYPGAIDEIINLGECLDNKFLAGNLSQILRLTKQKKSAYTYAYFFLKCAGINEEMVSNEQLKLINQELLVSRVNNVAELVKCDKTNYKPSYEILLSSSFGRYGKYSLGISDSNYKNKIIIKGNNTLKSQFLNILIKGLISDSIPFILHPSPLNDSITEAVLIPESSISIKSEGEGEYVDLESCSITDPMSDEVCRTANKLADEHRENAKRWFSVASGIHSTIEQIYSSCMDFDIADKICESLCLKISNALG